MSFFKYNCKENQKKSFTLLYSIRIQCVDSRQTNDVFGNIRISCREGQGIISQRMGQVSYQVMIF